MKKITVLLLLICALFKLQGQSQGIALNTGYTYINTNAGYIGGEYAYRFDPENWHGITIGVGTYYGSFNHTFKFIPETHLTYSYSGILGEFSITPHNINPSLGLSLANFMRLKTGYSWKLGHENINMTGITFGISFLIGASGFYDHLMYTPSPMRLELTMPVLENE